MKKLYIAIFMFCLLSVSCTRTKPPEKWTDQEAWGKLKKGMTEQQVVEILGKPKQKIQRGAMKWYYQEAPREIHSEPTHGFVRFFQTENSSTISWYLYDWQEPHWERVEAETK